MELTQEYFDQGMGNLLEKIDKRFENIETNMVTKSELKDSLDAQTKELKGYTHQAFETQQVWMEERFDELVVAYDVRDRVDRLEKDVAHLKLNKTAHA